MSNTITEPKITPKYGVIDDYCDCDEKCDKCGKKKKTGLYPIKYTLDSVIVR